MEFITNFKGEIEPWIKKACKTHNLKYEIKNKAYSRDGILLNFDNYKALYVDSTTNDLSDFWKTIRKSDEK